MFSGIEVIGVLGVSLLLLLLLGVFFICSSSFFKVLIFMLMFIFSKGLVVEVWVLYLNGRGIDIIR